MNEIVKASPDEIVPIVEKEGLDKIIKPLVQEIHLFDSYIAGTTHLDDKSVLDAMKIGDKLSLYREDNKFDKNAILIMNADKKKLGYVPEKDNLIFARLMDAGKLLCARITKIELKGDFYKVAIGIYLVDF